MLQRLGPPWRGLRGRGFAASMRAVLWHGDPDPAKMKVGAGSDKQWQDPPSGPQSHHVLDHDFIDGYWWDEDNMNNGMVLH